MAIFNGFLVPTQFVWLSGRYNKEFKLLLKIEGYIIDIFFLVDIILLFFTSFLCLKNGKEITDGYEILINYAYSRHFFMDVLSMFGSEVFTS
jgi:hypothetical protein